jgi:hypothetical protein
VTPEFLEISHRRFEGVEAAVQLFEHPHHVAVVAGTGVGSGGDHVGGDTVSAGYEPFFAEYADGFLRGGHGNVVGAADRVVGR